jgi:uncharacterized metal-binding protein YceD (DUF177 family)
MSDVLIFTLNDNKRKTVDKTVMISVPPHRVFVDGSNDNYAEISEFSAHVKGLVTPKRIGETQMASVECDVTADITMMCDYCLSPVKVDIKANVEEDVEANGTELDIIPLIEEAIILSLPMSVSCVEDCKGLCHQCGTNLNNDKCNCECKIINPQFTGLNI